MAKSKQRKKHKQKVNEFKDKMKKQKNSLRNSYMKMLQTQNEQQLDEKITEQQNDNIIETKDIDIG